MIRMTLVSELVKDDFNVFITHVRTYGECHQYRREQYFVSLKSTYLYSLFNLTSLCPCRDELLILITSAQLQTTGLFFLQSLTSPLLSNPKSERHPNLDIERSPKFPAILGIRFWQKSCAYQLACLLYSAWLVCCLSQAIILKKWPARHSLIYASTVPSQF